MTAPMAGFGQCNGDMETFFLRKNWQLERFRNEMMTSEDIQLLSKACQHHAAKDTEIPMSTKST